MIFALDYDGTYTRSPELWLRFVKDAKRSGHEVVCITMRHKHEGADMCPELLAEVSVVFTSRRAKAAYLADTSLRPDVWIDDNPLWIFQDG